MSLARPTAGIAISVARPQTASSFFIVSLPDIADFRRIGFPDCFKTILMDNRFNGVLAPAREASGNKAALTGGEPSHYQ